MRKTLALVAIGMALTLTGCGKKDADSGNTANAAPGAAQAPYSGQDWSQTVVRTAEGGFRMGKADAPIKLVEYASMTCPHCRDFTKEGSATLKEKYVRTGKISWEFRNFVMNALDVTAAMGARCQGPDTFFPFVDQLFASQTDWMGKYNSVDERELQRIGTLPQDQQFFTVAEVTGLNDFFKSHGVPADRVKACLSDKAALEELVKMRDHGVNDLKVDGTPSFFIDGEKQEGVYDWPGLEAKLRERVR